MIHRRNAGGFSLLEVIAAIMLLALAFGALMQIAGGSMRLSQKAAEHTEAALWARTLLDSSYVLEPLKPGSSEGQFNDRYHWRMQVQLWNPPSSGPSNSVTPGALQLYQVNLQVLWGEPPFEQSASFSTMRVASPQAGAAGV